MPQSLDVLIVEDNEDDFILIINELKKTGREIRASRVETAKEMRAALKKQHWDLVISDYALPSFSAFDALEIFHQSKLDIPLIVVSGTIGEDLAVKLMKSGAHDYVMKDKLGRLVPAIRRELRDSAIRREHARMEAQMLQSQKLESLGVLAGGIAHDFNNILTRVIGNLSLIKMGIEEGEDVSEALEEAAGAARNAKSLTQQLLTFSKGGSPVKMTDSIESLLRGTSKFMLSGSRNSCEFIIQENLWTADFDKGQISQVIQNLVLNADQAMPAGGTINIEAKNLHVDKRGIPRHAFVKPGRFVSVSVSDQGVGIPEEHLDRIFDPYFTTKQEGSGLGLAVSYAIVKKHDGYLFAESKSGKGSTFTILLPASEKPVSDLTIPPPVPVRGRGSVLIMDDEPGIRVLASKLLMKLGYETDTAVDGREAIEKYIKANKAGEGFDIVLMDLTVPGGMGGREAVCEILDFDPDACCIVSSGYSTDPVMSEHEKYGFRGVATKPYNAEELSQAISHVLEKRN